MTYLLDTDITASWLNGHKQTVELLSPLRHQGLALSLMTYGEIYEGVYFGKDPQAAERGLLGFLRRVDVLPISKAVLKQFARVRGHLRSQGLLIPDPDILIGATALQHNLTLLTGNRRHFERIPGLMIYPTA
jgi:tRNA(fMet)-specific endonuclease VapC